jgi:hypothetical protein
MQHSNMNTNTNTPTRNSVRLFPRLASPPAAVTQARGCQRAKRIPLIVEVCEAGPKARDAMRSRLLKMIVNNERVRRQEPHAS